MSVAGEEIVKQLSENDDEEYDRPILSSEALQALREFLNERSSARFVAGGDEDCDDVELESENWRLSQFWYDRRTAETLAEEVGRLCSTAPSRVACMSCPTLFAYIKRLYSSIDVQLLEYDKRFEKYGNDFTFYDYNAKEELPLELKHRFQVVVVDPPYLSVECLEKVAQTISYLSSPKDPHLILLTGEVLRERAAELLNVFPCNFRPHHSNKLGNEFLLYTNYDPYDRLGGWEKQ